MDLAPKFGNCWILPKVCASLKATSLVASLGKQQAETRGRRPIRITHQANQATSETLKFLTEPEHSNLVDRVCPRSGI